MKTIGGEPVAPRPPEGRREFKRWSIFSKVTHCQLVRWQYRDSEGRVYSGVAKTASEAKRAAEKVSGEKIK